MWKEAILLQVCYSRPEFVCKKNKCFSFIILYLLKLNWNSLEGVREGFEKLLINANISDLTTPSVPASDAYATLLHCDLLVSTAYITDFCCLASQDQQVLATMREWRQVCFTIPLPARVIVHWNFEISKLLFLIDKTPQVCTFNKIF